MNNVMKPLSVVIITMVTTLVCYSQSMFFGPMVTTSLSTSVGVDVASYGTPTRYSVGVQFSRRSASASEYTFTLHHRMENGGYLTDFVKPSGGIIGKLNVVDVPPGAPVIVTTLDATAIEAGAAIRLPILSLDTIGTRLLFQFGVNIDRVLSMTQVSDFSRIPEGERGNIPMRSTIMFDGQTGFGGQFGLAVSAPAGDGRFLIELVYNVRQPLTIAFPAGTASSGAEQNIGWLLGRGIRLGASYQFKM
jgi:hypothetical protein